MKTNIATDEAKSRFEFAQETARRLKQFGDGLHGLASVDAQANEDGTVSLRVEYFASDVEQNGSGDANQLFEYCADLGIEADEESPQAVARGAFGPAYCFTLG